MSVSLRHPRRVLAAAAALGVAADYCFHDRRLGIAAPLFVLAGLLMLSGLSRDEERPASPANLWLAAGALVFAGCLAWRDSPTLTLLNAGAAAGLLLLLAVNYRSPSIAGQSPASSLTRLVAAAADMAFQPAAVAAHNARDVRFERVHRLRAVGCGLLLALPLLLLFATLLASADQVFSSYVDQILSFELPFDLAWLVGHGLYAGFIAWVCAGGLLIALLGDERSGFGRAFGALARGIIGLVHAEPPEDVAKGDLPAEGDTQRLKTLPRPPIGLGTTEALTVLGAIDLLFGGFMAIQAAYFFGGRDTLARTGMTYAEYARRGFFELLAVACLALGLLCALAIMTRRAPGRERRAFNAACGLMIALVLGLLVSAFQRMALYERAYGFTELRLYTHSFMLWLALVLGLFLLALLRGRAALFSFGTLLSLVLYVGALNLANPDALIVRANLARGSLPTQSDWRSDEVDAAYLTRLSDDAIPALVTGLGSLDPAARQDVLAALAERRERLRDDMGADGWPGWHIGRARALQALDRAASGAQAGYSSESR